VYALIVSKVSLIIANLAVKGHRMANLILKCCESGDSSCLVRAFMTYVCPRLEYCSVAWKLLLVKNIEELEKVQRRFTKRLSTTFCITARKCGTKKSSL